MGVVREEQQLPNFIVHAKLLNLLKYFKLSTLHIIMEKVIVELLVVTFSISKRKYNIGCRGKHTAQISSLILLNHPLTLNVICRIIVCFSHGHETENLKNHISLVTQL